MARYWVLCLFVGFAAAAAGAEPGESERLYLSGRGKDDAVVWDFRCSAGRGSGVWSQIRVPSNWELEGFGSYSYGLDEPKSDERGNYRHGFSVPHEWAERVVRLVFEGSMTDTRVRLNGRDAGPVHQGGFYPFAYEVSDLLRFPGPNLLEVEVSKQSANRSVNRAERDADYWVFGGIYRPVYLEADPPASIADLAIDARADGTLSVEATLRGVAARANVEARILTPGGRSVGRLRSNVVDPGEERVVLRGRLERPLLWSAETPHLYQLRLLLRQGDRVLHRRRQRFGFRTVELRRGEGLFVNGVEVRLKGVNRHSFWPDSGRTTSPAVSRLDAGLIKEMNANAVRTAHYPPDRHFLDACDRLGIYVVDELAGWHDAYDTEVGSRLVEAMVRRDRNHPSIILWTNGNEDGWNPQLDRVFGRFDPQRRPVLHPRSDFGGVDTRHYPEYAEVDRLLRGPFWLRKARELLGEPKILLPTEFLHGLYDGGGGAGLADFWQLIGREPRAAGGFLWSLFDEGVVRTDRSSALDTDGSHGPDGLLGPYREKEASFWAVREIWSPIGLRPMPSAAPWPALFEIENRHDAIDLAGFALEWKLIRFRTFQEIEPGHEVLASGRKPAPPLAPGNRASLALALPSAGAGADALALRAVDPAGREVGAWRFPLRSRRELRRRLVDPGVGAASASESGGRVILERPGLELRFDRDSGRLAEVLVDGRQVSLTGGPRLVEGRSPLDAISHRREGGAAVLEASYRGDLRFTRWRLLPSGWLQLAYQYEARGEREFFGIGFEYPEDRLEDVRWLGPGPYRVWKNRTAGQLLDVWHKPYNDAVTGRTWTYPEFKGYHAPPYWVRLGTTEGPMTIVFDDDGIFLQLLRPAEWEEARHARAPFPSTDLGFLHAIPPIGTKFLRPAEMGPSGRREVGAGLYRGSLFFFFGDPPPPPSVGLP